MPTGSPSPIKFPEYYSTACNICGEPLKIHVTEPPPGRKPADLRLDWIEWRQHMREKHP